MDAQRRAAASRPGRRGARRPRRVLAGLAAVGLAATLAGCGEQWIPRLVSANAAGTDSADQRSWYPVLSPDGQRVAFVSQATNLGPADSNGVADVFVRDLRTGETQLVSVDSTGEDSGDQESELPEFSPDGTKVSFYSRATNLTESTPNGSGLLQLYVRDLVTQTTTLVSVNAAGTAGANGEVDAVGFRHDGNAVVFISTARDLVPDDTGTGSAVYERDLLTRTTTRIIDGGNAEYAPDGRTIAVERDRGVQLVDIDTGAVTPVSATLPGVSGGPLKFSADGRRLAFTNRTSVDNVFVFDSATGALTRVTVAVDGVSEPDNNFRVNVGGFDPTDPTRLVFTSRATNLVHNDVNGTTTDVFVRDLDANTTTIVSSNAAGTGTANFGSSYPQWLGRTGRVVFTSYATDLGPLGSSGYTDVYVRDLAQPASTLVSSNAARSGGGNGDSGIYNIPGISSRTSGFSVSADGTRIAFVSEAGDLGVTDTARGSSRSILNQDVYIADLRPTAG